MQISSQDTERLAIVKFLLILGVVFIHGKGSAQALQHGSIGMEHLGFVSNCVQESISNGIARVAVPLFFLLSGYLFFVTFDGTWIHYIEKINRRTKTLLLPFLFWNSATMLAIFIAQSLPATRAFFPKSSQIIASYTLPDFLNALLGFTSFPIAYQFWFIRDLMIMACITPLLHCIVVRKYWAIPVVFLLFLLWFFNSWPLYTPSIVALFFFFLGAIFGKKQQRLFCSHRHELISIGIYSVLLLADTMTKHEAYNIYIHHLGILFGIVSLLFLVKVLHHISWLKNILLQLSPSSFFIFAAHEPTVTVFKKITYKVYQPQSDFAVTLLYISIPLLVISLLLVLYKMLQHLLPKTLGLICGAR